jgi:serine/threonine protein kinase
MSVIPGQILSGQYRIDSFIASGGMGAVYRVFDLKRNVPLAMKTLHADLAADPASFHHFKAEANHLQNLNHPNIVRFYGLYQADDFTFILEDFIDGPTLKELLKEKGAALPLSEAIVFMRALCSALGYAHANQVVHCDVKPGNVMIDRSGKVFLTDFGIARQADATATTFASAGTPAYMAPEQILGEETSAQTDIYSLGIVLYEMVTGQRPFKGEEGSKSKGNTQAERIRYAHLNLVPPDPVSLNPAVPLALAKVISTALEKEPSQRFPGMREFFLAVVDAIGIRSEQIPQRSRLVSDSFELSKSKPPPPPPPPPLPPMPFKNGQSLPRKNRFSTSYALLAILFVLGLIAVVIFMQTGKTDQMPIVTPFLNVAATGNLTIGPTIYATMPIEPTITFTLPLTNPSATVTLKAIIPTNTPPGKPYPRGLIAFTKVGAGTGQIYLHNPQTQQTWKLEGQPANCQVPSFSWDGKTMLIRCDPTGVDHYQIYSIPTAGGHATQLTFEGNNMEGVYSPDGKRIVFVKKTEEFVKNIFIMDSSGRNERPITSDGYWNDDPQWSPDGQWLVFESTRSDKKCPGCSEVFLVNPDASLQPTMVTGPIGLENFTPAWSPDGQTIAFECRPEMPVTIHVCIIHRDGSNYKQLTYGIGEGRPAWSSDGKEIVFAQDESDGSTSISIMPVDASHQPIKVDSGYDPAWSKPFSE